MSAEKTIFQMMWDGEKPSNTIYRSDDHGLFVTLDGFPATRGHSMIIPKEPIAEWDDLPDERLQQIALLSKLATKHMREVLKPIRVIRFASGFGVPHAHEHLIPSYERGDTARIYDPARLKEPINPTALAEVQAELLFPPQLCEEADILLGSVL